MANEGPGPGPSGGTVAPEADAPVKPGTVAQLTHVYEQLQQQPPTAAAPASPKAASADDDRAYPSPVRTIADRALLMDESFVALSNYWRSMLRAEQEFVDKVGGGRSRTRTRATTVRHQLTPADTSHSADS
jgi:hypothetical protein